MLKSFYHGTTLENATSILVTQRHPSFIVGWQKSKSPWDVNCCKSDKLYLYDRFDKNVLWSAMMYAALTDYQGNTLCVLKFIIDEGFLSKDEYGGENAYMIDLMDLNKCVVDSVYMGRDVYSPYLRDIYICRVHELSFNPEVVSNKYVRKLCELSDFIDLEKRQTLLNEKILNKDCYERDMEVI